MNDVAIADELLSIELRLCVELKSLQYEENISFIYDPVVYAFDVHSQFVHKFCSSGKRILFLGLNPGPWGMSQTGVPFGEVSLVRDWLGLSGEVGQPDRVHPSRPVLGFDCQRSEVSGRKFWSLFQRLCGSPHNFFRHCFIYNYCPLAFLSASGKNITPVEFKAGKRKQVTDACDQALCAVLQLLGVRTVVALGRFAEKRASDAVRQGTLGHVQVACLPHPSPRNFAVKDWAQESLDQLSKLQLLPFFTPG
ncbi:single-strand selective monofunctional uracil DNA glycosylase [Bacillus rossius redtenbacheri]|uniref:single-strand selective monofunctional uracil DNA glycosylase n=1 Tax=Bacillus rossius redtenbacheri TaxID=93214 RepID=UPI002FDDE09C